jgi:hypothetical protein
VAYRSVEALPLLPNHSLPQSAFFDSEPILLPWLVPNSKHGSLPAAQLHAWRSLYVCIKCAGFMDRCVSIGAGQEAVLAPPVLAAGPGRIRVNKAVKDELAAREAALESIQCIDISGVCVPLCALYTPDFSLSCVRFAATAASCACVTSATPVGSALAVCLALRRQRPRRRMLKSFACHAMSRPQMGSFRTRCVIFRAHAVRLLSTVLN